MHQKIEKLKTHEYKNIVPSISHKNLTQTTILLKKHFLKKNF